MTGTLLTLPLLAATKDKGLFDGVHKFFHSSTWRLIWTLGAFFLVIFWLATAFWVFKDARRRIADPWLVAMATVLGLVPPFVGPLVYMLFRPPEYLEDVRERELEIKAMEERLSLNDLNCPVCHAEVDQSFLICPVCTTKLKQACMSCKAPLDALWQACPYCETPIERPSSLSFGTLDQPRRRRLRRARAEAELEAPQAELQAESTETTL